jgi:hypothetical protein
VYGLLIKSRKRRSRLSGAQDALKYPHIIKRIKVVRDERSQRYEKRVLGLAAKWEYPG